MPSGDAQRVWFPEMLARFEQVDFDWDEWPAVAKFCVEMEELRSVVRQAKGLKEPELRCSKCGSMAKLFNGISIRSCLFALRKCELISDAELKRLDRNWSQYRQARKLDKFGQPSRLKQVDKHSCTDDH